MSRTFEFEMTILGDHTLSVRTTGNANAELILGQDRASISNMRHMHARIGNIKLQGIVDNQFSLDRIRNILSGSTATPVQVSINSYIGQHKQGIDAEARKKELDICLLDRRNVKATVQIIPNLNSRAVVDLEPTDNNEWNVEPNYTVYITPHQAKEGGLFDEDPPEIPGQSRTTAWEGKIAVDGKKVAAVLQNNLKGWTLDDSKTRFVGKTVRVDIRFETDDPQVLKHYQAMDLLSVAMHREAGHDTSAIRDIAKSSPWHCCRPS
jgi:hypothetical protein